MIGALLSMTLLFTLLHVNGVFDTFNRRLSHGLYSEREAFEDILLVGIDEHSLDDLEEGGLGNFSKWPRSYYADVIEKLRSDGAQSIFIDVIFAQESEFIHFVEIAELTNSVESFDEMGREIAAFLEEHPSDAAFHQSLDRDVYLLKYGLGHELNESSLYSLADEQTSTALFTDVANSTFSDSPTDENEQAFYTMPVAYYNKGTLEESMSLTLARDFLYPDEEGIGVVSPDGKWYQFDEERRIPIENGSYLINYAQESYSIPTISFTDLVRGELEPGTVTDKIVLIGPTAAILQDRHFTPIDEEVPMPGVEIQANAIQTILDNAFLRHQGNFGFVVMLGVMLGVSVVAFMWLPMLVGLGILAGEVIVYPFFAKWMFSRGVVLDLIWPIVALVATYLVVLAYRNFTEFREKRKLKTAFGHYVSSELVEQISANPDQLQLGGERRVITAMFLDIENFTSLSESLEPHAVVEIINTYFDALANIIMEHGGTVDKFEGDAIMALFGAPVFYEDHALRAAQTALAIRGKMGELNQATGSNLNIRIGLATGEAVVGNMGSKTRFDYTAMGDTVNTASRLEGANKFYGTRLMVNPGTFEATQEHLFYRRLDRVRLKGKAEAIDIFELLGPKEGVSETGAAVVNTWHQALEYYRNQDWDGAVARIQEVQQSMPEDGPSKTYLDRIAGLRAQPQEGWDGTWTWDKK